MRTRATIIAVLAAATTLVVVAGAPAAAACPGADTRPTPDTVERARAAVVCLVNRERTRRGMRALRENARLRRAAQAHTLDMVARDYFSHVTPGGRTLVGRVLGVAYLNPRPSSWGVGENLGWGIGGSGTPAATVRGWMRSPGHRANVLRRRFKEIGVGVTIGVPGHGTPGATYTANFGYRS